MLKSLKDLIKHVKSYVPYYVETIGFSLFAVLLLIMLSYAMGFGTRLPYLAALLGAWIAVGNSALYDMNRSFRKLSGHPKAFYRTLLWPYFLAREKNADELFPRLRAFFLASLALMLIVFYFVAPPLTRLSEPLQVAFKVVQVVGFGFVLLSMLRLFFSTMAEPYTFMIRLLAPFLGLFLFFPAFSTLGDVLDDFTTTILSNPETAFTLVLGLGLLWACFKISSTILASSFRTVRVHTLTGPGTGRGRSALQETMPYSVPLSKRDERVAAVHESGHVLAFALPEAVESCDSASLHPDNNSLGRVSSEVLAKHRLFTKNELRWKMYLTLAGRAAEVALLGQAYSGAGRDLHEWSYLASVYLKNGFGNQAYYDPINHEQRSYNGQVYDALRNEQLAYLERFFEQNRGVLEALADELQEKTELNADELNPFLNRVTFEQEPFEGSSGGE